jgi:hypothetical protein
MLTVRSIRRSLVCACALLAAACGDANPPTPTTPANLPSALRASSNAGTCVYSGRFVQTPSGGRAQTAAVTERIGALPGSHGGKTVTYRAADTETGGAGATFEASIAPVPSAVRVGSNITVLQASATSGGTTVTTDDGSGNGVFAQTPEVPQAQWNDTASRVQKIRDASRGSSIDDRYAADGSYAEKSVPVEGLKASAESYPDGNAVYQWPFEGGQNSSIAFSPPVNGKVDVLLVNASQHVTETITLRSWYPPGPLVLASDSFSNAGLAGIPRSCGVAKRFGRTAYEIDESSSRLDVIFGEYETTKRTRFVSPASGLLCLEVTDTLQSYYNYTTLALSGRPLTTMVTVEDLGLQSERATKEAATSSAALPLDDRLTLWLANQRAQDTAAIVHSLERVRNHP